MRPTIALAATCTLTLLLPLWANAHASVADGPTPRAEEGAVFVGETVLRRMPSWDDSYPTAATLTVRGSLPTPCHEPKWSVETTAGSVDVALWSERSEDDLCAQVTEPFEIVIPMGSLGEGEHVVRLEGEIIGRIDASVEVVADEATLVGASWSFGFCAGLCRAELTLDGSRVEATAGDHLPGLRDARNRGLLTATGRARIAAAMARLDGNVLMQLYGCPDCADGGAASLTFEQDGVTSMHLMDFGGPPDELSELYRLSMAVIDALMTCRTNTLVEIGDTCVPVE